MEPAYVTLIVFVLGYLYFRKRMAGKYFSKSHRADGKTVIITGATTGIGKETSLAMAERGAKVIMACRDLRDGQSICTMIIEKTKNKNVRVMHLDLSSFKSIRSFAQKVLTEESRLDVLINNASVMGMERCLTQDGLEMHMGVNHFGHFLLTLLLIDRLKESIPSRIVTVSHWGHTFVRFNKNDLNCEKSYNGIHAYLQSKLCNVLFTAELAKRLSGSGVTSNSLHPGLYFANRRHYSGSFIVVLCSTIYDIFCEIFLRTAESGAQMILFAALDFNYQTISGVYFDNYTVGRENPDADDAKLRSWLWDYSERVTGIRYPMDGPQAEDSFHRNSIYKDLKNILKQTQR